MDEIVQKAMMRWPNVPSVYGWLKLDRRGRWLIKGEPIANPTINAFIGRNYMSVEDGQWCFQNGPQRVFVELEHTPYVYRIWRKADGALMGETHNGLSLDQPTHCWLDNTGGLLINGEHGVGLVESQSLDAIVPMLSNSKGEPLSDDAIEMLLKGDDSIIRASRLRWNQNLLPLGLTLYEEAPKRFGFDRTPQPPPGQPAC